MKISIVEWTGGDWVSLFLNGEAVAEGHSISEWEWNRLLEKLGHEVDSFEVDDEDGSLCYLPLEELERHRLP